MTSRRRTPWCSPGGGIPAEAFGTTTGAGSSASRGLNSETFETQKKTEAQIAVYRRLPRHFNAGSKDGIVQYRKQNKLVEISEIENLLDQTGVPERTRTSREPRTSSAKRAWREQFALRISFWANVALLVIKVFGVLVVSSRSSPRWTPSWTSSAVSSVATEKSMRKQNKYLAAGKSRMQPLGIIVFSCIIGTRLNSHRGCSSRGPTTPTIWRTSAASSGSCAR